MSEENVEKLRAFFESWNAPGTLAAVSRGEGDLSLFDAEVTYEDTVLPDHVGETYRGHEGMLRATQRWLEPFEELTIELERIVGEGDRLVSVQRSRGRAKYTNIEFDVPYAYFWTFRDGKVIHLRSYLDPADALEAAGLSRSALLY